MKWGKQQKAQSEKRFAIYVGSTCKSWDMALLSVPSKYENDRKLLQAFFKKIVKSLRVVLSYLVYPCQALKVAVQNVQQGLLKWAIYKAKCKLRYALRDCL